MTTPYDPTLRRDTPLARKLIARIRRDGPIDVHAYMDACLNDAAFGYYRTRGAIGQTGDFITAPEISQIFGELIGLWSAVVWRQMGAPGQVALIELGAGRGTLLADALRAARLVPGFRAALSVHVLDQNPAMIAAQRLALADCGVPVAWHAHLADLPSGVPTIWVANEFLDTIPAAQVEWRNGQWSTRAVGLDASGQLAFVAMPGGRTERIASDWPAAEDTARIDDGSIFERQSIGGLANTLANRAALAPLAGLFIDYGTTDSPPGDTLQAVRAHHPEHILASPGEADLSVYVDFSRFSVVLQATGARIAIDGPITQAEFLGRLGIVERASKLMATNPSEANALETGVARLLAPQGMGTRFLAIGARSAGLPPLPGLSAHGLT